MEDKGCVFKVKGVTGVGSPLETGDDGISLCQIIYDLAFSLITPLKSENNVYIHNRTKVRQILQT